MELILILFSVLAAAQPGENQSEALERAPIPVCTESELVAFKPDAATSESHRRFEALEIPYASDEKPGDGWSFKLALRIDEGGHVRCYRASRWFGDEIELNSQRTALLEGLCGLSYEPFKVDGTVRATVVTEDVFEFQLPAIHRPFPDVPLEQVLVSMERTACFGTCPAYRVEIAGDGWVTYRGDYFVDVHGKHRFQVPVSEVESLLGSIREKDIWSMKESYQGAITDMPSTKIELHAGDQKHQITDYAGFLDGMPRQVRSLQEEIDRVARASEWVTITPSTIALLEEDGFDFQSGEAMGLLERAAQNDEAKDDHALVELLERMGGYASQSASQSENSGNRGSESSLLDKALRNGRARLAGMLIARDALTSDGVLDQDKVDSAFRSAIVGGYLDPVMQIWAATGTGIRPALEFLDEPEYDDDASPKHVPVTLLLSNEYPHRDDWEGLAIARWLAEKGCDLRAGGAEGDTLLHVAADAGDLALTKYLIDQGLDVNAKGQFDLTPLSNTSDESVAMALLESGGRPAPRDDENDFSFRQYAREQGWQRVMDWIASHPEFPQD
ncbi:MAG: ankyrin repeat domain-containing protein [Lysobacteraceae bacterium]